MKETHMTTFPTYALLCELGEGDVVTLNYHPKSRTLPCVELTSGGHSVAKTNDILRSYASSILFLGKMFDPDVGRDADLYCRDLRYVAAAIKYVRLWRFDKYNSNETTDPERLVPFPDEESAIKYLKSIGEWEAVHETSFLYPMENWQPI